jgi:carboxylesterase
MQEAPSLTDIGPPPPGTRELRSIAPLFASGARRRWPWWLKFGLLGILAGLVVAAFGVWLLEREARAVLAEERAAGAAPGVVRAGFEPFDRGPRDAQVAVLFVHGFRSSPADFRGLDEPLVAAGRRVVALLLPGHGTCSEDLAAARHVDWIAAVADAHATLAREHAEVHVVGFSLGAATSLVALADTPPTRLVLIAPYFGITPRWYAPPSVEAWAELGAGLLDMVDSGPVIHGVNDPVGAAQFPFLRVLPTSAVLESLAIARAARVPDLLAAHTGRVLTIVSNGDTIADPAAAARAHAHFPNTLARLERVERSDHVLLWDHDAEHVRDLVVTFLTTP